jgi:hypothetical protein
MTEIHSEYNKKWKVTNANLWLSQRYRECPLIADDILRAVSATTINPYVMFTVGCVTSQWYSLPKCDYFACGLEGSLEDQIVNASIAWQEKQEIGELNLNEGQLNTFDIVWRNLSRFMDAFLDKPPDPLPKPPEPPKPPKPPELPPTLPEPPTPPEAPKAPGNWKNALGIWVGVLSAAMVVAKIFLPGPVSAVLDVILKLLKAIVGS